ncbi:MAG: permease, partial [Anaerolineae bacterium]
LVLSLGAGFITHFVVQRGWLGQQLLRARQSGSAGSAWDRLRASWRGLQEALRALPLLGSRPTAAACCAAAEPVSTESRQFALAAVPVTAAGGSASCALDEAGSYSSGQAGSCNSGQASSCSSGQGGSCRGEADSFWRRLLAETWDATAMVVKFMLLAFFLSALIKLYVPEEWVAGLLGRHNPWAIPFAAFLGVPAYASNLTALPMLDGLLAQGMSPSAALAFLIAGPTTTIPAMAAVWGLTSRRVFALYVSFSLVGAVVLGYAHSLLAGLF